MFASFPALRSSKSLDETQKHGVSLRVSNNEPEFDEEGHSFFEFERIVGRLPAAYGNHLSHKVLLRDKIPFNCFHYEHQIVLDSSKHTHVQWTAIFSSNVRLSKSVRRGNIINQVSMKAVVEPQNHTPPVRKYMSIY